MEAALAIMNESFDSILGGNSGGSLLFCSKADANQSLDIICMDNVNDLYCAHKTQVGHF